MSAEPTVFVVDDDDQGVRDSLSRLMESSGLPVEIYPSAEAFLANYDPPRPGCLVLDIRMRGMSGLDLQDKLVRDGVGVPIIVLSAYGDVDKAVQAMRSGAVDFIKKPYKGKLLLERVRHALQLDGELRRRAAERAEVAGRLALLTPRERAVLDRLVAGQSAKEIGLALGLARRTVDLHRAQILLKLRADSLLQLAQMVQKHLTDPDRSAESRTAPGPPPP